jgi:hypothetical protein
VAGLISIYGLSGVGKTLDICRCFQHGVVLLTDRDGLRAVQTIDKRTPRHVLLADRSDPLVEVRKVLTAAIRPLVTQKKATAVIVSTATELADRVLGMHLGRVKDPRQAFQAAQRDFLDLTQELLELGVWLVYECHESQPVAEDYRIRPGGPKFPGKNLEEDVVYMSSIVLRALYDTAGTRMYACDPSDSMWRMKDRYNICGRQQPMDLLALLKKTMGGGAVGTEGEKA